MAKARGFTAKFGKHLPYCSGSSGKTEELPFDTSGDCAGSEGLYGKWLPADDYLVVIECDGKVYESNVHLSPAHYCSATF